MVQTPQNLREAALGYAGRSIPIFPLRPRSKVPLNGSSGWRDATTDVDQIEKWWSADPNRNVACVPGQFGHIAVDIDTMEQLEAWKRALDEKGDPGPTRITESPSDPASRHVWFRSPTLVSFTKCEIELYGEKILIIGAGQYCLLPPSVHPVGDRYRFKDDQRAATAPDWLLEAVADAPRLRPEGRASSEQVEQWIAGATRPTTNKKGEAAIHIAVGELAGAKKGSRHQTLTRSLASLLNRAAALEVEIDLRDALTKIREVFEARFDEAEKRQRRSWKEVDELLSWIVGERIKAGEEPKHQEPPRVGGKRPIRSVAIHSASTIHPAPVSWLWQGRLPLGGLGLLAGPPGLGKTLVAIELAARVSTGTLEGDLFGKPGSVLYATAEDSLATTLVPRLIATKADLQRVAFLAVSEGNGLEESLTLPADSALLAEAVNELGAKLVVLDPVVAHIATELDSHRDHQVRRVLGPLAHLADETGAHVLGVAHLNKGVGGDFLNRVSGSVGFGAAVRAALGVVIDPKDPDEVQRILAHVKSNVGARAAAKTFRVTEAVIETEAGLISTARIEWGEDISNLAISDLLVPLDRDERGEISEAERIMLIVLEERPLPAEEARKLVRDGAGVSDRTIDRAKRRLGVESERRGGLGGEGWWEWSLPKDVKSDSDIGAERVADRADPPNTPTILEASLGVLNALSDDDSCRCGNPVERFTAAGVPYCDSCGPPS